MYLKSLEIIGFKSFADPVTITFEPEITAIVGPNGCGKSNIVDAIRWCLGEQSPKLLRTGQLIEVIFNGTQNRSPTGLAEVSLTFDNSDHRLPIDFSEVTVTRRLFRNLESEFLINKTPCRLKDIRDLFLDTGIGADGYSIISQGMVEFIFNAKPEERRELFEEATGIAKYKVRREEARRKLDKVEQDLEKISLAINLLKEQMTALESQARQARLYQKYQQELKEKEIAYLLKQQQERKNSLEALQQEIIPLEQEQTRYNTELDRIAADITNLRLEIGSHQELLHKNEAEKSISQSRIDFSDEKIAQSQQREKSLTDLIATRRQEIVAQQEKIDEIKKQQNEIETNIRENEKNYQKVQQEFTAKNSVYQELKQKLLKQRQELSSRNQELLTLSARKSELQNQIYTLLSEREKEQFSINNNQKRIEQINTQKRQLDQEIQDTEKKNQDLSQEIEQLQQKINSADREIKSLALAEQETELNRLEQELIRLDAQIKAADDISLAYPEVKSVQKLLELNLAGLHGPLLHEIKISPGYEKLVLSALGDKANYLLADNLSVAHQAIDYLNKNNLARITMVILDRIPSGKLSTSEAIVKNLHPLLSVISAPDYLRPALNFLLGEIYFQGNEVYGPAIFQGGNNFENVSGEKRYFLDKKLLLNRQDELFIKKQALLAEIKVKQEKQAILKQQIQENHQQLTELQSRQEFLKEKISDQKNTAAILNQELTLLLKENKEFEKKIVEINQNLQSKEAEQKELLKETEKTQQAREQLHAEIERISPQQEEMEKEVRALEIKLSQQQLQYETSLRRKEEWQYLLNQYTSSLEEKSREINESEKEIRNLQEIQKEEAKNISELRKKEEKIDSEIARISQELTARQNRLNELQKQEQELKYKLQKVSETLQDKILARKSYEVEMNSLSSRLAQEYNLDLETAVNKYPDTDVSEAEIVRLRRRLESMGTINLAAPEEYTHLEERSNFLLNQQQDMLNAKQDILTAISKINQITRENFSSVFETIKQNFLKIYQQLFEGGQADLILTDTQDLLNTGVEIMVQPPGKKLQNLSLLSGGEKALVSIALIFAFFMTRPSPFCLLDEVDAPLDDANIGRFLNLLRSLQSQTQFIIITHNKRTMEVARTLYGVTMEEMGVSKILAVRLEKEA